MAACSGGRLWTTAPSGLHSALGGIISVVQRGKSRLVSYPVTTGNQEEGSPMNSERSGYFRLSSMMAHFRFDRRVWVLILLVFSVIPSCPLISTAEEIPSVLASGLFFPSGIAVDATSVYWTSYNGVAKVNKNGGAATTLVPWLSYPGNIVVDSTSLYWGEASVINKVGKEGGIAATLASGVTGGAVGIAVDSTNLYWTENGGPVKQIHKNGGPVTVLFQGGSPAGIAVDSTSLYWTEPLAGIIRKMDKSSGLITILVSGLVDPYSITADSGTLYWTEPSGGTVKKVSVNGGSVTTLASGLVHPHVGIAADSAAVYWNEFYGTSSNPLGGAIKAVGKNGGAVVALASAFYPGSIAVDETSVYWTEGGSNGVIKKISKPMTGELLADANTIALYHFNEASGSSVADSSGNGNNGTAIGTTIVPGRFGNARSFNGSSDYITVPDSPSLSNLSQITIEVWVKPTGFDLGAWAGGEALVVKGTSVDGAFSGYALWVHRNAEGPNGSASSLTQVQFQLSFGGGSTSSPLSFPHEPNKWYYVVGTYDGNDLKVYVNGVLEATSSNFPNLGVTNTNPLFINHHTWGFGGSGFQYSSQRMGGLIDEVRISNIARSAAEIQSYYNAAIGSPVVDLTPPALTELCVTVGRDSARLVVTTDEPTTLEVFLRLEGDPSPSRYSIQVLQLQHAIRLFPLGPDSQYTFTLVITDQAGNQTTLSSLPSSTACNGQAPISVSPSSTFAFSTRRPVIFIPGILGSHLKNTNGPDRVNLSPLVGGTANGQWLWPNTRRIASDFGDDFLNELSLDDRGERDGIGVSIETGDAGDGEYADENPEQTVIETVIEPFTPANVPVPVYRGFLEFMENVLGYRRVAQGPIAATLRLFPYDWRLNLNDLRVAGRLRDTIDDVLRRTGHERVDIIAHSLGGMVAKAYLTHFGPREESRVKRIIMIGTPHYGAAKAIKTLLFGEDDFLGPIMSKFLSARKMKEIARNMPQAYQLIASEAYYKQLNPLKFEEGCVVREASFFGFLEALRNDFGLNSLLDEWVAPHQQGSGLGGWDAWTPQDPELELYLFIGYNNRTLEQILFKPTLFAGCQPFGVGSPWGDGTVPVFSAEANWGLTGARRYYVRTGVFDPLLERRGEHLNMITSNQDVWEQIRRILEGRPEDVVGSIERTPSPVSEQIFEITVQSPVELHIYDAGGAHLGPNDLGGIDRGIPGATYHILGETKSAAVMGGLGYRVEVRGKSLGTVTLSINEFLGDSNVGTVEYSTIPVAEGTTLSFPLVTLADADSIAFDADGDGTPELHLSSRAASDPLTYAQLIADVVRVIQLPVGIQQSLLAKLDSALKSLQAGNRSSAKGKLGAYLNEVSALSGKKIPTGTAETLTVYGTILKGLIP